MLTFAHSVPTGAHFFFFLIRHTPHFFAALRAARRPPIYTKSLPSCCYSVLPFLPITLLF